MVRKIAWVLFFYGSLVGQGKPDPAGQKIVDRIHNALRSDPSILMLIDVADRVRLSFLNNESQTFRAQAHYLKTQLSLAASPIKTPTSPEKAVKAWNGICNRLAFLNKKQGASLASVIQRFATVRQIQFSETELLTGIGFPAIESFYKQGLLKPSVSGFEIFFEWNHQTFALSRKRWGVFEIHYVDEQGKPIRKKISLPFEKSVMEFEIGKLKELDFTQTSYPYFQFEGGYVGTSFSDTLESFLYTELGRHGLLEAFQSSSFSNNTVPHLPPHE